MIVKKEWLRYDGPKTYYCYGYFFLGIIPIYISKRLSR